jgi:hypothetical protein
MRDRVRLALVVVGVACCLAVIASEAPGETNRAEYATGKPVDIGTDWALLADDYLVEDKIGIARVMGHLVKLPNSPVVLADLPWEDYIAGPSVVFDEKAGFYHMWYQGWNSTAWHTKASQVSPVGLSKELKSNWYSYWIGYATSRDGSHWEKPLLDLYPYLGFDKTNIVLGGESEPEAPFVWWNQDQSDPARRFLMTFAAHPNQTQGKSLMLAYSADGIHWSVDRQVSPLLTKIPDGSFEPIFDPLNKRWLLFRRPDYKSAAAVEQGPFATVRPNGRYAVSINSRLGPGWSFPRLEIVPDEEVERRDIDHMKVFRYGTHFIGLLGMMDDRLLGLQQVQLAVSHDGLQWTRFPYLPPILPQGEKGAFDAGQVHPPYVVDRGEFTYLYYSADVVGQRVQQGYYSSIGMARMRRGRWIALTADTNGGYVLTREVVVSGDHIEVNFQGIIAPYMKPIDGINNSTQGFIRLELLHRNDATAKLEAIPGFTLKESDALVGDNLAGIATWQGRADLSSLRGKPVYVRFHVVNSELWQFRFGSNN